MHFCPDCSQAMRRVAADDAMYFECPTCGKRENARNADRRVAGGSLVSGVLGRHQTLLRWAALDPAGDKVEKECPACGLPYMTRVMFGEGVDVVHTCDCGHQE